MLNRKFTEALKDLAKAKTRLAAAEEKQYAALIKWYFPDPQEGAPSGQETSTRPQDAPKSSQNPQKK